MTKPHVGHFVGVGKWEHKYDFRKTSHIIKKLKSVIAEVAKAERLSDVDELTDAISDIAWDIGALEDAIDIIEDYDDADSHIDDLYNEIEARLTDDEQAEFEQEQIIYKLKGT